MGSNIKNTSTSTRTSTNTRSTNTTTSTSTITESASTSSRTNTNSTSSIISCSHFFLTDKNANDTFFSCVFFLHVLVNFLVKKQHFSHLLRCFLNGVSCFLAVFLQFSKCWSFCCEKKGSFCERGADFT